MDRHALFADSLALSLSIEGYDARTFDVWQDPRSSEDAAADILRMRPRLVLLDVHLGRVTDGLELVGSLAHAGVDVVVLTSSRQRGTWGDAVHRGARRVLSRSDPLPQVLAVVHRLHQGLGVLSVGERQELLRQRQGMHSRRAELSAWLAPTELERNARRRLLDDDETCPEHA